MASGMLNGHVEPRFEPLRDVLETHLASGAECGLSVTVNLDGDTVVDVYGGYADEARTRRWEPDTIVNVWSTTKTVTSLAVLMLADRGLVDLDAPVATYWPEFARNGKEAVTVSDLLSHRAGLTSFEPASGVGPRELLDWEKCTAALAAMAPLWPPGTAYMYHAVTYGYLVGEVIRRVTGKMPGRFFADEIAGPLGLSLWIGLPQAQEHRVAPHFSRRPAMTLEQWTMLFKGLGIDLDDRVAQTMLHMVVGTGEAIALINSPQGHAAEIPAANMIGDAASLARMYAATIGAVDGVRLLKPETVARAMRPQIEGLTAPGAFAKLPSPSPLRYGLGYQLTRAFAPMLGEGSFGHDGAGGRIGFAHPGSGIAVGYVCNNMLWDGMSGPDARWLPWTAALREAVGM